MVVPDNVLFEDNTGRRLRTWLMELCSLHTVLRLPTGIFYAQGVKTNMLFFQRGKSNKRVEPVDIEPGLAQKYVVPNGA